MAKKSSKHKDTQYSDSFFLEPFPPNHNPLIGVLPKDTLLNVYNTIALLQELDVNSDEEAAPSDPVSMGYFYVMDCILGAIHFELYHREEG